MVTMKDPGNRITIRTMLVKLGVVEKKEESLPAMILVIRGSVFCSRATPRSYSSSSCAMPSCLRRSSEMMLFFLACKAHSYFSGVIVVIGGREMNADADRGKAATAQNVKRRAAATEDDKLFISVGYVTGVQVGR